ncbi:MAG: hypothetical protein OQK35_00910 [Alphaproteobacteria bacterium]|nr:hypothetical protein [Rhodospirillales bacterium]MCW9044869.1 hypothetical protein [Alphaproteobacteria bacterium]
MLMYFIVATGGFSGIATFILAIKKQRDAVGWGLIGIAVIPFFILLFLPKGNVITGLK